VVTITVTPEMVTARRHWVEALEYDGYEQAQSRLRVDDRYCCLGVACDVSGLGDWEARGQVDEVNAQWYVVPLGLKAPIRPTVAESASLMPMPVAEALGVPTNAQTELTSLNDNGTPFKAIAAVLRGPRWFGPNLDLTMEVHR
jgi:hypothetical protein